MVQMARGQEGNARLAGLVVVPGNEAQAAGAGVLQGAEAPGHVGTVLQRLELRLDEKVVVTGVGAAVDLVTPRSTGHRAMGVGAILGPWSPLTVRVSGTTPWLASLLAWGIA